MNECMGISVRKMSVPTHKIDQGFMNIWIEVGV